MRLLAPFTLAALLLSPGWCLAAENPQKIPFRLHNRFLILLQGSVGDQRRLNFIFDTGTSPCIIHQRLARALHLAGVKDRLFTVDHDRDVPRVTLPVLELGPVRAEALPALVLDLSTTEKELGLRLDGILGLDVFAGRSFTIDFAAKQFVFAPAETSDGVAFENASPYLIVPMQIQGRSLRLLVDSGAQHMILFAKDHPFPEFQAKRKTTLSNAGSQIALQRVRLPELFLGQTNFGAHEAFYEQDCARIPACSVLGADGLLPLASLGLRQINFDFAHRRISWKK